MKKSYLQLFTVLLIIFLHGCASWYQGSRVPVVAPLAPLATDHFPLPSENEGLIGQLQAVLIQPQETYVDLARQFNLGFDEIGMANPGVDAWVPKVGTKVILPTQHILPQVPRSGLVLNLPAMRLYYYLSEANAVITHPVGIGREGWATPIGRTKVIAKQANPPWRVPASIRAEHARAGDPLPAVVPAGPDNPLGNYVLRLGMPSYLIHGTNKPSGVGMQVSHGCVRLYPEDIARLYTQVPKGTRVNIVNQPYLAGWRGNMLYLEIHPQLPGYPKTKFSDLDRLLRKIAGKSTEQIDWPSVHTALNQPLGIPLPILYGARTRAEILAAVPVVAHVAKIIPFTAEL